MYAGLGVLNQVAPSGRDGEAISSYDDIAEWYDDWVGSSLGGVPDATFEGVVCHGALMDIPDLAPTFHSVVRVLKPGGWFVYSILHPCYHTARSGAMAGPEGVVRTVGGYFDEGY